MKIRLTIVIILITLISCQKQVKNELKIEHFVDLDSKNEIANDLTDILEIDRIIPLKGKLIGSIDKLLYFNNKFIIFDSHIKCIDVFSSEGNYLNSIGNVGKGPNEFVSPLDVAISNSGEVYVLDDTKQIKIYSLSGTFIDKIVLPAYFLKLEVLKDENIALLNPGKKFMNENGNNNLYIYSNKGKLEDSMLPIPEYLIDNPLSLRTNFQKIGDELHVVLPYNDTVYNVKKHHAEIQSVIKYDKFITPTILKDQWKNNNGNMAINELTNNYAFNFWFYLESDKFLAFSYIYQRKVKGIFYNKEKHNFLTYNYGNLGDPLVCLNPFLLYGNDSLISIIHPSEFISKEMDFRFKMFSANHPDLSERLKKVRSSMKIEDNPFIVLSKLKNN